MTMIWPDDVRFDHDYSFCFCEFIVIKTPASLRLQEIDIVRIKHHFIRAGTELLPNLALFIESAQERESGLHVFKSSNPEELVFVAFDPELPRTKPRRTFCESKK